MTLPEPIIRHSETASWFALQVKTTHEKRVASMLGYNGLECFLPLYDSRRPWSDRIKQVELPLFPGYVFCRFGASGRVPVLKTPSVTRIVGFGGVPVPIDDGEITSLQAVIKLRLGMAPHPFLQVGQRVRIEGGALCGLEGLITDLRRRNQLILSVSLLQRSVAVEIDSAWVCPVSPSKPHAGRVQPFWAPVIA